MTIGYNPIRAAAVVLEVPAQLVRARHLARARLGETRSLSQAVQARRKTLIIRHMNGMEMRRKRPRGFKKRPMGFK